MAWTHGSRAAANAASLAASPPWRRRDARRKTAAEFFASTHASRSSRNASASFAFALHPLLQRRHRAHGVVQRHLRRPEHRVAARVPRLQVHGGTRVGERSALLAARRVRLGTGHPRFRVGGAAAFEVDVEQPHRLRGSPER